ncbi:hypothetical protein ILUMI_05254 [Ignelater luminosus]|uniref:Transmembrane protein 186 n=1 Tax=Ignelater luminosus TaxID=2038154 RepID=A0A8K0GIU2_IGNLU|nr:hypothetical protein ILUMI_05254 [Ignelater luminosus]
MLRISQSLKEIYFKSNLRSISIFNANYKQDKNSHQIPTLSNFTPIYKFEYVRVLSIVNRLKFYNTIFTGVLIPSSLILSELEVIHQDFIVNSTVMGLTTCASLYIVGILANKFIGFVYLNKEENSLRIAYIDFWGHRKDIEVPLNDMIPFSEVPTSITDLFYLKFCRFSNEEVLKINFKYGIVLNRDKFKKVFPLA